MLMSSVVMLFISFTTVYVVRKAGETWDPASNGYVSHWVSLSLPLRILLLNTAILLLSSATLEVARRARCRMLCWLPLPTSLVFALAGITHCPGCGRRSRWGPHSSLDRSTPGGSCNR